MAANTKSNANVTTTQDANVQALDSALKSVNVAQALAAIEARFFGSDRAKFLRSLAENTDSVTRTRALYYQNASADGRTITLSIDGYTLKFERLTINGRERWKCTQGATIEYADARGNVQRVTDVGKSTDEDGYETLHTTQLHALAAFRGKVLKSIEERANVRMADRATRSSAAREIVAKVDATLTHAQKAQEQTDARMQRLEQMIAALLAEKSSSADAASK
jgi:hypothetical protein